MNQLEKNIVNSFNLAKRDIVANRDNIFKVSQTQNKILDILERLTKENKVLTSKLAVRKTTRKVVVKKAVAKRVKVKWVASKTGKKFHQVKCPYAQNIKPNMKVRYQSKTKALNEGYKPCTCVK